MGAEDTIRDFLHVKRFWPTDEGIPAVLITCHGP